MPLKSVEFNLNKNPEVEKRQRDGNSGVYVQQRYEIQILNSHHITEEEYKRNDCGSIYGLKKVKFKVTTR